MSAMQLRPMLRLEGVKGNAKVRLPERGHIETSMMDGIRLASISLSQPYESSKCIGVH